MGLLQTHYWNIARIANFRLQINVKLLISFWSFLQNFLLVEFNLQKLSKERPLSWHISSTVFVNSTNISTHIETFPSLTSQKFPGNFSNNPKKFQTLRDFPDYLDFFRLPGTFLYWPETFHCLEIFITIYRILRPNYFVSLYMLIFWCELATLCFSQNCLIVLLKSAHMCLKG